MHVHALMMALFFCAGQVLPNRELRPSEAAHLFIKRLQMQSVALRETNGQLDKEEDAFVFSARLKCTKL
eukprot:c23051_g1_i4 orf=590-796(+)